MFQTQNASTAAPKTTMIPTSWAETLRQSLPLGVGVAGRALGIGGVFSTDGAVARSFIRILIFEKDQRFEAQVGVNSKADQQQPNDERADEAHDNAQHPCGKIRAKHVHRRRMSTAAQ